jgi:hypothetical protein
MKTSEVIQALEKHPDRLAAFLATGITRGVSCSVAAMLRMRRSWKYKAEPGVIADDIYRASNSLGKALQRKKRGS